MDMTGRQSRRTFLKATAASAFPLIYTGRLSGAEAPGNEITMATIGVGGMGTGNLNGFLHSRGVRMLAVCDVDDAHTEKAKQTVEKRYAEDSAAGTYKGCDTYRDFRDLLERDDIDAVCIATPDHWHVPIALRAVRNGKDVYCEKPLSVTIAEGRLMSDAVRRYGRVFQMGSQQRSDTRFRFACELVRNGRIGNLQHILVGLARGRSIEPQPEMPVPKGFDYDLWLGPAPYAPYTKARCHYNFRFQSDYSGGQMLNWGSHHLDIAQWGMGTDRSGPVSVRGTGQFPDDGLFDNPVSYEVDYAYANGVTLNCSTSNRGGITFIGTEGRVFVDRGRIEAEPASLLREVIGPEETHLLDSRNHRGTFLDCIRTRKETAAPCEVGHRSATMGHMGNIAMRLGRRLQWDPDSERFVGDDEANRMLSRADRSPWLLT